MLSLYSLIWTFLISCPMVLLIFILRRRSDYLSRYGVTFILILYIFCTVRMLVPIEIPGHQKIIRDPYLFSYIMNMYAKSEDISKEIVMAIVFGTWIIGIIVSSFIHRAKLRKAKKSLENWAFESDGRAERILKKIDASCNIDICYSALVIEPFIQGLFHPTIYLPDKECNDRELEFILTHEYLHWKRKDLWKKTILLVVNIIFWWNPLAYLLRSDLNQIIELNCDNTMSKRYSELQTLDYLDTLTYMAGGKRRNFDEASSDSLGFIKEMEMHPIKQRFQYVMFKQENRKARRKANIFIFCCCFIWFTVSYYFILQPDYGMPTIREYQQNMPYVKDKDSENEISIVDDENSYLEELEDGSYLFHYAGYTEKVSKKDVESGMYNIYPIIKYEKK